MQPPLSKKLSQRFVFYFLQTVFGKMEKMERMEEKGRKVFASFFFLKASAFLRIHDTVISLPDGVQKANTLLNCIFFILSFYIILYYLYKLSICVVKTYKHQHIFIHFLYIYIQIVYVCVQLYL